MFDREWAAGVDRPEIESVLGDVEETLRASVFVELVAIEWEWRVKAGEARSLEDIRASFPEFAHLLDDEFETQLTESPDGDWQEPEIAQHDPWTELPGTGTIGEFQIVRELGRGGMGIVYAAHQESLDRDVALKILPGAVTWDERRLVRFQREARATAQLRHPSIASVYGSGFYDGVHYIAMDLINGVSLAVRADRQTGPQTDPQPSNSGVRFFRDGERERHPELLNVLANIDHGDRNRLIANIGCQTADALQYAHGLGILHRDVKPSNLMLDDSGHVWLMDFGLARTIDDDTELTETGELPGTLRFLPPEMLLTSTFDARSDVYSLGLTLYELLLLRPAFDAPSRPALLNQLVSKRPSLLRRINPNVPRDLETIVMKAIEADPERRYQTAADLTADLKCFLEKRPISARRTLAAERFARWCRRHPLVSGLFTALLVLVCVILTGFLWVQHQQRELAQFLADEVYTIFDDLQNGKPNPKAANESDLVMVDKALDVLTGAEDLIEYEIADDNWLGQVFGERRKLENTKKRITLIHDLDELQLRSRLLRVEFGLAHWGSRNVNKHYVKVLKEAGLDVADAPARAVARLNKLRPETRSELIVALNHWFLTMGRDRDTYLPWLSAILDDIDDDTWRQRLRSAVADGDAAREAEVLSDIDVMSQDTRLIAAVCYCDGTLNRERDEALQAAHHTYPTDFWINHTRALRAVHFYRTEEGIQLCGLAHAIRPGPITRRNLAAALLTAGHYSTAAEILRSAVQEPKGFELYALYDALAQAEFGAGNHDAALEAMTEALKLKDSLPALNGRYGEYLYAAGRFSECENFVNKDLEGRPAYNSFVTHARLLHRRDRLNDAIATLQQSETFTFRLDERAPIRDLLYDLLGEAGRADEQQQLRVNLLESQHVRLQMWRNKGHVEKIRYWCDRILRIDPKDDKALFALQSI